MINRHGLLTAISVIIVLGLAGPVFGQDRREHALSVPFTGYIAVVAGGQEVGGGFEGDQVISSVEGFFAIPTIGSGAVFGLSLGVRTEMFGMEGSFLQSQHTVRMGDFSGDGQWRGVEIEGRVYAPEFGPVTTFAAGGISMEWLSVDNAYCSDFSGTLCTARFEGLGFSVGPGLLLPLADRFFVSARLTYHHTDYDTIESVEAGEGTLPFNVEGDGWMWLTGIGMEF